MAGAAVIAMLVRAYPDAVDAADGRGRTPLGMAEELPVESPRRADYLRSDEQYGYPSRRLWKTDTPTQTG